MAGAGKIVLSIDKFITNSRLRSCRNKKCKFRSKDSYNCDLKEILLDETGSCEMAENKAIDES